MLSAITITGTDAARFQRLTSDPADCSHDHAAHQRKRPATLRVQFDPGRRGAKTATLTVTSNADDISVALTGTGTQTELSARPAALSLGSQDIDDGPAEQHTVDRHEPRHRARRDHHHHDRRTNASLLSALTDQPHRLLDEHNARRRRQSCELRVQFDPASVGAKSGALTVGSPTRTDVTVALSGTGTQTSALAQPHNPGVRAAGHRRWRAAPRRPRSSRTPAPSPSRSARSRLAAVDPSQFQRLDRRESPTVRRPRRSPPA